MIDEKNDLDIGIDLVTTALRDVLAFATDGGIDPNDTKEKILRTTIMEIRELMDKIIVGPIATQLHSALEQATSERTASGETRAEAVMETIATIEACYAIVAGCERVIWGDEE